MLPGFDEVTMGRPSQQGSVRDDQGYRILVATVWPSCSGRDNISDRRDWGRVRVIWSEEEASFPTGDFSAAAGRATGRGDGAVGGVPVASSGSPFSVYVTLGRDELARVRASWDVRASSSAQPPSRDLAVWLQKALDREEARF
ncbi:hypothetical protein Taro_001183 [Colocasia esculenta]|uniref:Uncharacterized protein n=1 Tax=Colocasia esculenta TaxID=4460 RepID=A0A843TFD5_COLES|nr:hypothetical protein [Colocasia esculenta]